MFRRISKPCFDSSYFVFGARGTGKTTWIKETFKNTPHLWLNLLDPELETELLLRPSQLKSRLDQLPANVEWVIIDEIQKAPKLLDVIHNAIESTNLKFVLTGSSSRKLKRGGANLLAGRALIRQMFPLTLAELNNTTSVDELLHWGSLPKIFSLTHSDQKEDYLRAYTQTYLSEEIVAEQLVRNLIPFRKFLPVAAQQNGHLLNYSKLAKDTGADDKTIQSYFEILEDTLIGFRLYPFHSSFRKRLSQKPKFYFFDLGVARALARSLELKLLPQTSAYGDAFEHLVILEAFRRKQYFYPDYELNYIATKEGAEIDLVIDRPGAPPILVEIKSTTSINQSDLRTLENFSKDLPGSKAYCLSQDPSDKKFGSVTCLPWTTGLEKILPLKNFTNTP